MHLNFNRSFKKQYKKLPNNIQTKANERLFTFQSNQFDIILGNHTLHGKWKDYRSINITGNHRAIYKDTGTIAYFVAIGTHSELYS